MTNDSPFCQCNQCVPPSMLMRVLGTVGKAFLGMLIFAIGVFILWGFFSVIFSFPLLTAIFAISLGSACVPAFGFAFYLLGRDVWSAIRGNNEQAR